MSQQDQPLLNGRCQCGNLPTDCTCQQDKLLSAHKTLIDNIHCSLPYFMHKNVIKAMEQFAAQQVAIAVAEKDAVIAARDKEIEELKAQKSKCPCCNCPDCSGSTIIG